MKGGKATPKNQITTNCVGSNPQKEVPGYDFIVPAYRRYSSRNRTPAT